MYKKELRKFQNKYKSKVLFVQLKLYSVTKTKTLVNTNTSNFHKHAKTFGKCTQKKSHWLQFSERASGAPFRSQVRIIPLVLNSTSDPRVNHYPPPPLTRTSLLFWYIGISRADGGKYWSFTGFHAQRAALSTLRECRGGSGGAQRSPFMKPRGAVCKLNYFFFEFSVCFVKIFKTLWLVVG